MDDYPAFSLDHNLPLLVALGVSTGDSDEFMSQEPFLQHHAVAIRSELPPLDSPHASAVLGSFQSRDGSKLLWGGARETTRRYRFRFQAVERCLFLPPRQAGLPDGYEAPQTPPVLHSPFSPLSPASSLYPDGLIDARWLKKHQALIPSVLLCFYELTLDPGLATLHDNQIKTDIASIRAALGRSGYKTKLAVVILANHAAHSVEGIQERADGIRKGSGVDSKACFLVPPQESQEELERIVENALTTLYGQAVEYYRDLGRHARKKRSRGAAPQPTIPPTTGTSQTLALSGWGVRYDFKSAVFAEFRQDMDAALRSFEQAYDALLSAEVLELIPSWSPRWNEARLLADVISVRSIRCLLWNGQHSAAVRRWQMHRTRIRDFVERRGRGTNSYGWEAWEARWAVVMANMLERSDLPDFAPPRLAIYLPTEKALMGERSQPWELLHHTGYWYHLAAQHLQARRALAYAMPEDDRRPPGSSPASQVAGRAFTYDTYMCPDPHEELPVSGFLGDSGVDHGRLILDCLAKARAQFVARNQPRISAQLAIECAQELAALQDWEKVLTLLSPLWEDRFFRAEGWRDVAECLGWLLRSAAVETHQAELVLAIDWELLERHYTRRPDWHYDITRSLDGISTESQVFVKTRDSLGTTVLLQPLFVFEREEGKAGETIQAQLTIQSNAMPGSAPISLSGMVIHFTGNIKPITLAHESANDEDAKRDQSVVLNTIILQERSSDNAETAPRNQLDQGAGGLFGRADLTFNPGSIVVFQMAIPLREPGEASAISARLLLHHEAFELEHILSLPGALADPLWYLSRTAKTRIARSNLKSIRILPRPPKLEIRIANLLEEYYTNEDIELSIEIHNAEDSEASGTLDANLFGEDPLPFRLAITGKDEEAESSRAEEESTALAIPLDKMGTDSTVTGRLKMGPIDRSTRYDLTLKAAYHLSTDPATPITQSVVFQLNIISPFEANYELLPRLHPDPWPSIFDPEGVLDPSDEDSLNRFTGLSQKWCLATRYASFASQDLTVDEVDLRVRSSAGLRCVVTKSRQGGEAERIIRPKTIAEASFDVTAQRRSLDDRGVAALDMSFVIKWSRTTAATTTTTTTPAPINTTILPVPPFTIFLAEPRVLASVIHPPAVVAAAAAAAGAQPSPSPPQQQLPSSPAADLLLLRITIENPSAHLLTFGLAMEPSDDFAFSGPKKTTAHLLPLSRRAVDFRLLPRAARGVWVRPALVVRDKYFQKVLRVLPASESGLRADRDGLLLWLPETAQDGDEE